MFVGLARSCLEKDLDEFLVRGAVPHGPFQIFLHVGEQAGSQPSARGQAEPVAGVAEVMCQGAYKAYLSRGSLKPETLGRTVTVFLGDADQISHPGQSFPYLGTGHVVQAMLRIGGPQGHVLNEPYMIRIFQREPGEIRDLMVADVAGGGKRTSR